MPQTDIYHFKVFKADASLKDKTAPENLLATVLDGLGVGGYKGRKIHIEKWKEECMLNKTPLLPHSVLKKVFN